MNNGYLWTAQVLFDVAVVLALLWNRDAVSWCAAAITVLDEHLAAVIRFTYRNEITDQVTTNEGTSTTTDEAESS